MSEMISTELTTALMLINVTQLIHTFSTSTMSRGCPNSSDNTVVFEVISTVHANLVNVNERKTPVVIDTW